MSRIRSRILLAAGSSSLLLSSLAIADTTAATTEPEPDPAASESSAAPAGPISVIELAPGVTAEVFAAVPSDRAPDQTVYLARFVFEPGSEIVPHNHPGTAVIGVESGTWGWTLLEGTAHVVRGAAAGNTEVEDMTEPGIEVLWRWVMRSTTRRTSCIRPVARATIKRSVWPRGCSPPVSRS